MAYEVVDGRLRTVSLEAHIVDHCNLRCRHCCSLSPLLDSWFMPPDGLARDLRAARRALAPGVFKIVGGEPLLHPEVVSCLRAAKDSQIAPRVSVTTNGLLLPKMTEAFWSLIDALTISLYPQPALPARTIALVKDEAARRGIPINWKIQNRFEAMDREVPMEDDAVNRQIWRGCWLRRRCNIVARGRFYACTRPPHYHSFFRGKRDFISDGVLLDGRPGLAEELRAYLEREEPLKACSLCLGGDSERKPHAQMSLEEIAVLKGGRG